MEKGERPVINENSLYSVEDVAELFSAHPRTIRRMFASGALPGKRVCRRWWCRGGDLLAFFEEKGKAPKRKTARKKPKRMGQKKAQRRR